MSGCGHIMCCCGGPITCADGFSNVAVGITFAGADCCEDAVTGTGSITINSSGAYDLGSYDGGSDCNFEVDASFGFAGGDSGEPCVAPYTFTRKLFSGGGCVTQIGSGTRCYRIDFAFSVNVVGAIATVTLNVGWWFRFSGSDRFFASVTYSSAFTVTSGTIPASGTLVKTSSCPPPNCIGTLFVRLCNTDLSGATASFSIT